MCLFVRCSHESAVDPRFASLNPLLRGNQEIFLDGETVTPSFFAEKSSIGICVSPAVTVDTTRWRMRLGVDGSEADAFIAATKRTAKTLCFEAALSATRELPVHQLCPVLKDESDGASVRLPCASFRVLAERSTYDRHLSQIAAIEQSREEGLELRLEHCFSAERQARDAGFPLLAFRFRLLAVDILRKRGQAQDWVKIDELLTDEPPWLGSPAALLQRAQLEYQRGMMLIDRNQDLKAAWRNLQSAAALYDDFGAGFQIFPRMQQADLVGLVGSPMEARQRLTDLIHSCEQLNCPEFAVETLLRTRAWQALLDVDASESELHEVEAFLQREVQQSAPKKDLLVSANLAINLAFAKIRLSHDPREALHMADRILATSDSGGIGRAGLLLAWLQILRGRAALLRGELDLAAAACRLPDRASSWPHLATESLSCTAQVERQRGNLPAARATLARALSLHTALSGDAIAQPITLGPSRRAEDFYLAAELAIEDGDAEAAWATLEDLDGVVAIESYKASCNSASNGQAGRLRVTAELDAISGPASKELLAQRQQAARSLRSQLREFVRSTAGCKTPPVLDGIQPNARVFAVDHAVISLWRSRPGAPIRVQKFRLERDERNSRLDQLENSTQAIEQAEWKRLTEPFAKAIVPSFPIESREVTVALYGAMQRVPITTLQVEGQPPTPWGAVVKLVVVLAGSSTTALPQAVPRTAGLFVVDPKGNLTQAATAEQTYRRLFPDATVLSGRKASRNQFLLELGSGPRWMHFDGHGRFDPAFPELSSLELADGEVIGDELAEVAGGCELINLSGCKTGRSPVSADSGRFGLAGPLIHAGVRWVVVSRSDLDDGIAADFNAAFYRALGGNFDPPEAFRVSISSVSQRYPPAAWGGLILVGRPLQP